MRSRRLTSAVLVVSGTSVLMSLSLPAAQADAPSDRGWWTVSNPGPPAPAQPPSDVPADGLLVQGGPTDAPAAYAGLIYEPDPGATAQQLVLKVVSPSATTPGAVLELCPLKAPTLNAEQGGPMADAPAYDCAHSVTAAPTDGSYTFTLSALGSEGLLAVAVLPTAPSTRVVLAGPGADSLRTSSPATSFPPEPSPTEAAATPQDGPVAEAPSVGIGELPATTAQPSTAPEPVVAGTPTPSPSVAPVVPTAAAAATGSHHAAVGAVLLALLAAGCGLWAYAGRNPLLVD